MRKQFRDFESAREFVRSLNLKEQKEWYDYCRSGDKPDDIPATPYKIYQKEWKGFGDFSGNGKISNKYVNILPFKEAREFARSLNLKNGNKWREYCRSGDKPDNIPSRPERFYKNDFKGVDDWLGTRRAPSPKEFVVFTKEREFARSLNLKNRDQWEEYCRSGKKPNYIVSRPNSKYKKEWKGWGDFLGTGTVQNQQRQYRSFLEAREFARSLNLKTNGDWNELAASNKLPNDIPHAPEHQYKNKGWKGAGDFLGTGTVAPQLRQYRSFIEAREFVRSLGLKNHKEWKEYCKSGDKPEDIPAAPWMVYKEWKKK
jgi:hypothetical protein